MTDDLILVGFGHASIIDTLRPDVAYPSRKVKVAKSIFTELLASPCTCSGLHVSVWVQPVETP